MRISHKNVLSRFLMLKLTNESNIVSFELNTTKIIDVSVFVHKIIVVYLIDLDQFICVLLVPYEHRVFIVSPSNFGGVPHLLKLMLIQIIEVIDFLKTDNISLLIFNFI